MKKSFIIIFCLAAIKLNAQIIIITPDLNRATNLVDNRITYDNKLGWVIDFKKLDDIIISDLNRFRRKNDLSRLRTSGRCDSVAGEQSRYMVRTGKFFHERDSLDFTQRIRLVIGGGHFGENLFHEETPEPLDLYRENYESLKSKYPDFSFMWESDRATYTALAREIIKKWIDSPSHYKNLINPLWRYFSVFSIATGKEIYVTLAFEE
jgi:uncharacterized protein YkwD